MKNFRQILMLSLCLASVRGYAADRGESSDTIHLRELEVVHFIAAPAFISSGADTISMSLMSGRSLSELLVLQPALYIKSAGRGALSTASFRGTDASHTKVYWNGMKLNSPMLGQVDFSLLPVFLVDDLSLLCGGSSLEAGGGALGGAVLLENSADWQEGSHLRFSRELGSFRTSTSQGRLSFGDDKLRSVTRIFSTRSRNDYEFLNTDVIPAEKNTLGNAAYSIGGIMQEIYIKPAYRDELSLRLWYQESDRELPPLMSDEGADREERQNEANLRTSVEWKSYRGPGTLTIRSSFASTGMHYHLYHPGLDYMQFDSRSSENSLFSTLGYEWSPGSRSRIRIGASYNRMKAAIRDFRVDNGYRHGREEFGMLASGSGQLGSRTLLYVLLRQERAEGRWLPAMPSAGLRLDLLKGGKRDLQLRANLSRNFNLPSLNDLYWIPGGNRELRPEKGINSDLSLEYEQEGGILDMKASLNLYAARVEDWILWKPTQYRYWEPVNIAEVFSRGFDARLGTGFRAGGILFNAMLNYALTRSTDESDASGNQLIYIPVHTSSAFLNMSGKGYYMNWTLSYTGRRYTRPEASGFDESLNPYVLNDVHIGKSFRFGKLGAGLRIAVYNIFNVNYQAVRSRPMPGRNYEISLNLGI